MKSTLRRGASLAATLALLAGPALAQPMPNNQHQPGPGIDHPAMGPPPHADNRPQGGWHKGDHFSGQRMVVNDWDHHHLHRPPQGYEWVQSGPDFVLIAVSTGVISSIIAGQ